MENNLYDININGAEYQLRFTLQAIDYLDNQYTTKFEGFDFGMGVLYSVSYLESGNPVALFRIIKAGLLHLNNFAPTDEAIENQIVNWATNNQLEGMFEKLGKCLRNSPLTKGTLQKTQEKPLNKNKNKNKNKK